MINTASLVFIKGENMKFLNGWAILWVLFLFFTIVVDFIGGAIAGQLYLFKEMVMADFSGTIVVSFVLEILAYMIPERGNNE